MCFPSTLPSLKLTVRTWTWMLVGLLPFRVSAYFQGNSWGKVLTFSVFFTTQNLLVFTKILPPNFENHNLQGREAGWRWVYSHYRRSWWDCTPSLRYKSWDWSKKTAPGNKKMNRWNSLNKKNGFRVDSVRRWFFPFWIFGENLSFQGVSEADQPFGWAHGLEVPETRKMGRFFSLQSHNHGVPKWKMGCISKYKVSFSFRVYLSTSMIMGERIVSTDLEAKSGASFGWHNSKYLPSAVNSTSDQAIWIVDRLRFNCCFQSAVLSCCLDGCTGNDPTKEMKESSSFL